MPHLILEGAHVCDRETFRRLWQEQPELRGKLFLEDEIDLLLKAESKDKKEPSRIFEKALAAKAKNPRLIFDEASVAKL